MKMDFRWYSDPGHGWLAVPMGLIKSLGIADKISCCSYRRGNMAYLEEDCDATIFIDAWCKKEGLNYKEFPCTESHTNNDSWIRNLQPYWSE